MTETIFNKMKEMENTSYNEINDKIIDFYKEKFNYRGIDFYINLYYTPYLYYNPYFNKNEFKRIEIQLDKNIEMIIEEITGKDFFYFDEVISKLNFELAIIHAQKEIDYLLDNSISELNYLINYYTKNKNKLEKFLK